MTKKIIFQDSFLVSGIMCYGGCGQSIKRALNDIEFLKQQRLLPQDAQLTIDAEPHALGVHRLFVLIESNEPFEQIDEWHSDISRQLKDKLDSIGFDIINSQTNLPSKQSNRVNWVNILINVISIAAIITLSTLFPPSILLTVSLTTISFVSTAFTARNYLINFFRNIRNKDVANMTTSVTFGWLFALTHTLYHAVAMPLASGFSMIFMSYIMPVALITIINVMDEINRLVMEKAKKMQLQGVKALFPQMAQEYICYELAQPAQQELAEMMGQCLSGEYPRSAETSLLIQQLLEGAQPSSQRKNSLKNGMVIQIKRGECFPVDCILLQGNTLIDASLVTGEPQQNKGHLELIPAGAVNLGQAVTVYALGDSYSSTVNKLLFRSNRERNQAIPESSGKFTYLYTALIIVSMLAAVLTPLAFGILTIPLFLQNITGILFAVCPCTIAIAHQLPKLLSLYERHHQGITLRHEALLTQTNEIHTIVFDKTGTLTTGSSEVDSSEGISSSLWQRIYLLEKHHGGEHPLAKAINHYYETRTTQPIIMNDIGQVSIDSKNRGLSGIVQGKSIHIGSYDYLQESGVRVPASFSSSIENKLALGYSIVYVAEDNVFQGGILIKHEVRKDILTALNRFKKEGKKLLMLTGDSYESAMGFNRQTGGIFDAENIHAKQTPQDKETFLQQLMGSNSTNAKGIWFIGDGLNDAPCARIVTEKGGVSCAMTSEDKAAFFTDISLNGSLDYVAKHNLFNRFLKKNVTQNQGILTYGIVNFLAFILTFSIVGIPISPLIPLVIMASTTLLTLFNSYRIKLSIEHELDKHNRWHKHLFASDLSLGLLLGASTLLTCAVLIAAVASGVFTLPAIIFTAGVAAAASGICLLASGAIFSLFIGLSVAHLSMNRGDNSSVETMVNPEKKPTEALSTTSLEREEMSSPSKTLDFRSRGHNNPRSDLDILQQATYGLR